jgi:hypothetical protein
MPQAALAIVPEILAGAEAGAGAAGAAEAGAGAAEAGGSSRLTEFAKGQMSGGGDKKKESKQSKPEPELGNQIVPLGV